MAENARPSWLVSLQVGNEPVELQTDGGRFSYTLVQPNLEPRLPYVVGGHVKDNSLFISADVPEDFRPFILKHEIDHDTKFAVTPPEEACVEVLKLELAEAILRLGDRYNLYLYGKKEVDGFAGRIEFFNALVKLYEDPQQVAARGAKFVEGIKRAAIYLNGLNP